MATIDKRTTAFIETQVDDEIVIVGLDEGRFYSLKDTGLAIWQMIDGTRTRDMILSELEERFDAPADVLARDLDGFLDEIVAAGFANRRG